MSELKLKPISISEAVVFKELGDGGIQQLSLRIKNIGTKLGGERVFDLRFSDILEIANKPVGATLRVYTYSFSSREEGQKRLSEERRQARIIRRSFADVLITRAEERRQNSPMFVDKS